MRPCDPRDAAAVLMCVTSDAFVATISQLANGSKMPRADWEDMASYEVPVGTSSDREALSDFVTPKVSLIQTLAKRNATLRKVRDLLLPKLLSGEVDVSRLPLPPEEPIDEAPPPAATEPPRRGRRRKDASVTATGDGSAK